MSRAVIRPFRDNALFDFQVLHQFIIIGSPLGYTTERPIFSAVSHVMPPNGQHFYINPVILLMDGAPLLINLMP